MRLCDPRVLQDDPVVPGAPRGAQVEHPVERGEELVLDGAARAAVLELERVGEVRGGRVADELRVDVDRGDVVHDAGDCGGGRWEGEGKDGGVRVLRRALPGALEGRKAREEVELSPGPAFLLGLGEKVPQEGCLAGSEEA